MSLTEETVKKRINKYLSEAGLKRGTGVCAAFSGGPDSTALLFLLREIAEQSDFYLCAGYVEHGIRPFKERAGELRAVQQICEKLGVALFSIYLPPGLVERTARKEGGIEAAARTLRYMYLKRVLQYTNSSYIATGHTRDDQLETIMMRFFQGSGISGLRGMGVMEPPLLRPIIDLSREDVLHILMNNSLTFSTDSTNSETDYLRNSVRHNLIPAVRRIFPKVDDSIRLLRKKMVSAEEVLKDLEIEEIRISSDGLSARYDHNRFFQYPFYIRIRLLYNLFNSWFPDCRLRLPYRFLASLCEKASESTKHIYGQGYGFRMERIGTELFWSLTVVHAKKNSYLYKVQPGLIDLDVNLKVLVQKNTGNEEIKDLISSVCLRVSEYQLPCIIRSPREGDTIHLNGKFKKVKELIGGEDRFKTEKHHVVIIEDRSKIRAVVQIGNTFNVFRSTGETDSEDGACVYRLDFLSTKQSGEEM